MALHQTSVVDRAELVHQEIRVAAKAPASGDPDTEGFGVRDEVGRERDDQCRRVIRLEQSLRLNDEDRARLARFRSATRLQVSKPHTPLRDQASGLCSILANSALTRMLSFRTLFETAARC